MSFLSASTLLKIKKYQFKIMNCKYRITYKGKCWHHCFMRINVIRESRLGNRTGSTAYRISPNLHKSQPACTDQMSLYNSSKAMKLAHIPICKYIHMQNKKKNASFTTLKIYIYI